MINQLEREEILTSQNVQEKSDWKKYWRETELVPSTKEDKQLPFLIETLKKELDINKIQTVLEVGVGYGRVAKVILDTFPIIDLYDAIDISENAIKQSEEYLKEYMYEKYEDGSFFKAHSGYCPYPSEDFMECPIPELYDLVISVETMSCVPENISIQPWIKKMCSLSKKYVVNLDYVKTTDPVLNNGHDYETEYEKNIEWYNNNVFWLDVLDTPNPNEKLFICRVK